MYFWTLNSNMFPEFLYHPHFPSRLKGWNLLRQDTKLCFYRGPHEEFKDFFSQEDGVFYNDICSVMEVHGSEYNPDQWPLLIDSSKLRLKHEGKLRSHEATVGKD